MKLLNKVAIITGAASGIGRATAILFAKEGAKIVVADIDDSGGEETVSIIKANGGEAVFVHTDVSEAADTERLVKTAVSTFGKLDILHNNAGKPIRSQPTVNVSAEEWDSVYAVNVKSIFLGIKYAVPEMMKGGGVIINTASISGMRPRPLSAAYTSSKAAAIALTKTLALELAGYNIRVNVINPVAADTAMLPLLGPEGKDTEETKKAITASIPLGRLAQPEDVAYAALYLASDEASMLTGSSIDVDGGRGV
ncbi:SDR family oxidoreductase [Chloroflexota bacterium]